MKTTKLLIMLVAAATIMFATVSCEPPEEGDVAANTLVYNGTIYKMTSTYTTDHSGRVYIDANATDKTADGLPIFNIVSDHPGNGTYNLATGGGVFFRVTSEVNYITSFESSDSYTVGTVIVEKDDKGFRMKMAGKLASGPEVAFHIYVPASEWGQLDF
ncbi:MAG: hypothetical protein IK126_06740 [Bacteroidales bacterium]|nr:hypothetical protein [Bacteroidales bacterium]